MHLNHFLYGLKKVGFTMKIHVGGSSGIAVITWGDAALMMKGKLSDGKLIVGT